MPIGTQVPGSSWKVYVGTADPPTILIGGLSNWDYPSEAPSSTRNYYNQDPLVTLGTKSSTITATVDIEQGDTGQLALDDAWYSGATIFVSTMRDVSNGEKVPVKVTNRSIGGPDPNNPSVATFTLGQQASPTKVGGGLFA